MYQNPIHFTFENFHSQEADAFEKTACFCVEENKESPAFSIALPSPDQRRVSFDLSPSKSRPNSKQGIGIIKNSRTSTPTKTETRIENNNPEYKSRSLSPLKSRAQSRDFSGVNVLRESFNLSPQAQENQQPTLINLTHLENPFRIKPMNQEGDSPTSKNLGISPKKLIQQSFNRARAPRSESCIENRSQVPSREGSKEGLRARSPGGKYNSNLARLNRIKVLSPLPTQNANCFSPPLQRISGEQPAKLNFDLGTLNLPNLPELKTQNMNIKLHPIMKKFAKQNSMQENTSNNAQEEKSPKPVGYGLSGRSPIYNFLEPSPTLGKEIRFKLPAFSNLQQTKKLEAGPVRAGIKSYRLQSIDFQLGSTQNQKGVEAPIPFPGKLQLGPRPNTNDNYKMPLKLDGTSAGPDSHRNTGASRFKIEEMILNKLFKPIV